MKESASQKRATRKYISGQYRPSVYIDKRYKENIENHFHKKGFNSFNEYIIALIKKDVGIDLGDQGKKEV